MKLITSNVNELFLPTEWYYQSLKVAYMFKDNGRLVCKIEVPMIAREQYIGYNIHTHPVRNPNGTGFVRIYHNVFVALATMDGSMFFPDKCKGIEPLVCHAGIEFDKGQNQCIRGLIAQDAILQRKCPLVFSKEVDVSQSAKQIMGNTYVVYTSDENYKRNTKCN